MPVLGRSYGSTEWSIIDGVVWMLCACMRRLVVVGVDVGWAKAPPNANGTVVRPTITNDDLIHNKRQYRRCTTHAIETLSETLGHQIRHGFICREY